MILKKGIENLKEFDLSLIYTIYGQLIRPTGFLSKYDKILLIQLKKELIIKLHFL